MLNDTPPALPFLIEIRILPYQLVLGIHKNLNGMACDKHTLPVGTANLVVEDYFCCLHGAIGNDNLGLNTLFQWLSGLRRQIHYGRIGTILSEYQIVQTIIASEGLAGIFEILGIGSMPNHPHGIYLAEADTKAQ